MTNEKGKTKEAPSRLPLTHTRVSRDLVMVKGLVATKALTLPDLFLSQVAQVCQKDSHVRTAAIRPVNAQLQLLQWLSARTAEVSQGPHGKNS